MPANWSVEVRGSIAIIGRGAAGITLALARRSISTKLFKKASGHLEK
jgi:hypothetical protein